MTTPSDNYRMGDEVRGEQYVVAAGVLCGCCGLDGAACRCSWACALADACTASKTALR